MGQVRNYEQAIYHFREAKRVAQEINVPRGVLWADMNLGNMYMASNKLDSALLFFKSCKGYLVENSGRKKILRSYHFKFGNHLI